MKLEIVIQELLYTQDFITIPGLGSLVTQYQPARIIKSDHVKFVPPHKIIAFNQTAQEDNSILRDTLCKQHKLSKDEAEQEIKTFVNKTKEILKEQKIIHIAGIGDLLYNSEGKLSLKPDVSNNYLIDSYGLKSFHVHAVPEEDALKKAIEKQKGKVESIQKKIAKTSFLLLPIIFAIILIPNILHIPQSAGIIHFFRNTEVAVDMSNPLKPTPGDASYQFSQPPPSNIVYDSPLTTQTPPTENEPHKTDDITEETIADAAAEEPDNLEITEKTHVDEYDIAYIEEISNPQFYIIVGSFSDEQRAEEYAQELRNNNHNAGVLVRDSRIRVYISLFDSRENALASLENVRNKSRHKDAWMYAES